MGLLRNVGVGDACDSRGDGGGGGGFLEVVFVFGMAGVWGMEMGKLFFESKSLVLVFWGDVGGLEGGAIFRSIRLADGEEVVIVWGLQEVFGEIQKVGGMRKEGKVYFFGEGSRGGRQAFRGVSGEDAVLRMENVGAEVGGHVVVWVGRGDVGDDG